MKTCPKCGGRLYQGWKHLCNAEEYFNVRVSRSQLDRIETALNQLVDSATLAHHFPNSAEQRVRLHSEHMEGKQ